MSYHSPRQGRKSAQGMCEVQPKEVSFLDTSYQGSFTSKGNVRAFFRIHKASKFTRRTSKAMHAYTRTANISVKELQGSQRL